MKYLLIVIFLAVTLTSQAQQGTYIILSMTIDTTKENGKYTNEEAFPLRGRVVFKEELISIYLTEGDYYELFIYNKIPNEQGYSEGYEYTNYPYKTIDVDGEKIPINFIVFEKLAECMFILYIDDVRVIYEIKPI